MMSRLVPRMSLSIQGEAVTNVLWLKSMYRTETVPVDSTAVRALVVLLYYTMHYALLFTAYRLTWLLSALC